MQRRKLDARIALFAIGLTAASACVPGYVGVGTSMTFAPTAELVEIAPGVWVVTDQPQPIYFDAGYYWWWRGGIWWRSPYYDRNYVRVDTGVVPVRLQRMDHRRYRRYHAPPGANVRPLRGRDRVRDDERTRSRDDDRARDNDRNRGRRDEDRGRGRGKGHDDDHDRGRRGHD